MTTNVTEVAPFVRGLIGGRPFGVFSIRDFGATGSGADETGAIQAALNAARDAGGGTVYVPVGTYICGNLILYGGVHLVGASWAAKLKQRAGAQYLISSDQTGTSADPANNKRDMSLSHLWLEGRSVEDGFEEFSYILNLNAVSDVSVADCRIVAPRGDGIYLGSSNTAGVERHNERVVIRRCYFDGVNKQNRNGISIIDCDTALIESCYFTRFTRADMPGAIDIEPDSNGFARVINIAIRNNRFQDIGGGAGVIGVLLPLPQAALTRPSRGISIEGNFIETATTSGIVLRQVEDKLDSSAPNGILVRNNHVLNTSRGFEVRGVKQVLFEANEFITTSASPLVGYLDPNSRCQDIVFKDNLFQFIDTALGSGVAVFGIDRLTFEGNTFFDCGKADGTFGYAIDFNAGTSGYVQLLRNRFISAGRTKFAVQREATHTFAPTTNLSFYNDFIAVSGDAFQAKTIYGDAGALKYRGSAGTSTTVAPS